MVNSKHMRLIMLVLLILDVLCLSGVGAFGFSAKVRDSSPRSIKHDRHLEPDLTALVGPSIIDHSEIYTEALSLLTSMQAAPSCNRVAASLLLTGCQSLDGSGSDTETSIEHARSIYAAQLAVCEIVSAGSTTPQQCKSLEPTKAEAHLAGPSGFAKGARYGTNPSQGEVTSRQLEQCLRALESRPQWWTSYSNNRQNAVVMCKAAREDIAKDDLINLHQSIVSTNKEAHSTLSNAVRVAQEGLTRQSDFAAAVETFQQRLLRDLESSSAETRSYFTKAVKSMESFTQSFLNRMTTAVKHIEDNVIGLEDNIHDAKNQVVDLQKNVDRVFQEAVTGSAELAASQTKQWYTNQDLATDLQHSLANLREVEIRDLLGAFGIIHSELRMSNELISGLYQRQNMLDKRFIYHDQLLASLNSNAEAIHATQTRQASSQAVLLDQMQAEIYVARGLLADITSSAANLQASVEHTSSKIANMATLSGITTSVLRWGWLTLLVFILYQFSPRYAGFAAAGLATFLLLWFSGVPSPLASIPRDAVLIHYASGYQVPLVPALKIALLVLVLLMVALFYRLSAGSRDTHDRTVSIRSRLPFYQCAHQNAGCHL